MAMKLCVFQVGQDLMRPFGMDDDDFELDYIFERNVATSFAIVDRLQMADYMPLEDDQFWKLDGPGLITMPRTGLSGQCKQHRPIRHVPSYRPNEHHELEEGRTRCNALKKRWHGYE
ncbi:unnamed protein product [Gongylonema pulchrum]|uniref:Bestrophin homolog n=1 Tax=Gongylonema pulchrum TaxID=637853 RepID=A0A183DC40_9BILA|nr:unnamed protein product [Gongylonema pulchrum]